MKKLVTLFKLLFAVYILLITTISQAQESKIPSDIDFDVGEQWEWARINNDTKKPEYNFFRNVVNKQGKKLFFDGKNYSQITETFLGGSVEKSWRIWPIKVGNKWQYDNKFTSVVGVEAITNQHVEVLDYEEVTVTAGTFMAYKIAYIGTYRNSIGTGIYNETYWYAPSIKADVKYISEDGLDYYYKRELISYSTNKSTQNIK